jgi:hypothetical protein
VAKAIESSFYSFAVEMSDERLTCRSILQEQLILTSTVLYCALNHIIGARTMTRTLDPLIKSHRKTVKYQGSF